MLQVQLEAVGDGVDGSNLRRGGQPAGTWGVLVGGLALMLRERHFKTTAVLAEIMPAYAGVNMEAELDAQLFMIDLKNASEISKMAEKQTQGMDRKVLWASLYGQNDKTIGGGENKNTFNYVFSDDVMALVSAATKFLHGRKVVPAAQLRKEAIMDQVARDILAKRGLKSPIGSVKEQPLSNFK